MTTSALTAAPSTEITRLALHTSASGRRTAINRLATVGVWAAFVLALVPLVWILGATLVKGLGSLTAAGWFTNSQRNILADEYGGGAVHAIQGTLIQGVVTSLIAVPIGILTAVYLVEYGRGRFAKVVNFTVDILTGIPSIIAALFIYALWVTTLGLQRVPFAVALSLVILMVPVIVRSTEEMLRIVPNELREASYALGVPKWKTILSVVLPTALSGITTGVLLGAARVMGETAPLIILGPYTAGIATNLFGGYMATLPTMINEGRYNIALEPSAARTWGAALTLILMVLILNLAGRLVARFSKVR
jgi:phosphate transport system permease protein